MNNIDFYDEILALLRVGLRYCEKYEDTTGQRACALKRIKELEIEVKRRQTIRRIRSRGRKAMGESRIQLVDLIQRDRLERREYR